MKVKTEQSGATMTKVVLSCSPGVTYLQWPRLRRYFAKHIDELGLFSLSLSADGKQLTFISSFTPTDYDDFADVLIGQVEQAIKPLNKKEMVKKLNASIRDMSYKTDRDVAREVVTAVKEDDPALAFKTVCYMDTHPREYIRDEEDEFDYYLSCLSKKLGVPVKHERWLNDTVMVGSVPYHYMFTGRAKSHAV